METFQEKEKGEMLYECVRCGTLSSKTVIDELDGRCINCRYRIFKKVKPPVVRRFKAI